MDRGPPQFVERAVELIKASPPTGIDQRRLDLLPLILEEWRVHDLPHLSRESRATVRTRYDRLKKVGNSATHLRQALEALDEGGRDWIALEIGREELSHPLYSVSREKFTDNKERLKQEDDFLGKLAAATLRLVEKDKRGPGQPRNISAYRVMMDIAAIFEWLTKRKAARGVDRIYHTETGPFFWFAESIWPVAFGNTRGLKAAIKNFAEARKARKLQEQSALEQSALLSNINSRHPTWGIFED